MRVFFFKHETAYEMRISDWSSDVCSSDLPTIEGGRWRRDQMESTGHYRHWRKDFERVREIGVSHLRYGPPLHLIFEGPCRYDWSFTDTVMEAKIGRAHV